MGRRKIKFYLENLIRYVIFIIKRTLTPHKINYM